MKLVVSPTQFYDPKGGDKSYRMDILYETGDIANRWSPFLSVWGPSKEICSMRTDLVMSALGKRLNRRIEEYSTN